MNCRFPGCDSLARYKDLCWGHLSQLRSRGELRPIRKMVRGLAYYDPEAGIKWCPGCKKSKFLDGFAKNASSRTGRTDYCKACTTARLLARRYGVTPQWVEQKLAEQGYACAGCKNLFNSETPHVDHDHETKEPRGLLCFVCNMTLGYAKDSSQTLRNLADYLDTRPPK